MNELLYRVFFGYYAFLEWVDANSGYRIHFTRAPLITRLAIQPVFDEEFLMPYFKTAPKGAFVDIGANKGEWSKRMKAEGRKVYAFEPNPQMWKHLRGFEFYPVALGDSTTYADMALHVNPGTNSLALGKDTAWGFKRVPVYPLDYFGLKGIGLIKIDTEGFELPILKGAVKTLQADKPRLIIEVHGDFPVEQAKIEAFLRGQGYVPRVVHYRKGQPHLVADFGFFVATPTT